MVLWLKWVIEGFPVVDRVFTWLARRLYSGQLSGTWHQYIPDKEHQAKRDKVELWQVGTRLVGKIQRDWACQGAETAGDKEAPGENELGRTWRFVGTSEKENAIFGHFVQMPRWPFGKLQPTSYGTISLIGSKENPNVFYGKYIRCARDNKEAEQEQKVAEGPTSCLLMIPIEWSMDHHSGRGAVN